jgi:hypothetical protein
MEATIFFTKQKVGYYIIGIKGFMARKFAGLDVHQADDSTTVFVSQTGTIPKGIESGTIVPEITSIKDGVIEWAK